MKLQPMLLIGLLITATSFLSTAQHNQQYDFVAIDNSLNTRICLASVTNNLSALKQLARLDLYGVRGIAEELTCNNKDITNFAAQYGASKTTKYLSLYAPQKYKINLEEQKINDVAYHQLDVKPVEIVYISGE